MAKAAMLVSGLMMMALSTGCGASAKSGVLKDDTMQRTVHVARTLDASDYARLQAAMQPESYDVEWSDTRDVSADGASSEPQATMLSPEKASAKDRLRFDTDVF